MAPFKWANIMTALYLIKDSYNVPTKYIFLDIDGVLLPCVEPYDWTKGFNKECVANLKALLDTFPEAVLVVSSDWRFDTTVDRFNELLEQSGLGYNSAVVAVTPMHEFDKDFPPDLRDREIADYVNQNDIDPIDCVALEDSWPITCVPVVMCDPKIGLTEDLAREAFAYLSGETPFYDINAEVQYQLEF